MGPATVDSGEYLSVAVSLRAGEGLQMPYVSYDEPYPERLRLHNSVALTHFPPLCSLTLAAGSRISGAAPGTVARWLNAVAYALTAVLAGLPVWWEFGSGIWSIGTATAFAAFDLVAPATMVWSETLQLVLLFTAMAALAGYVRSSSRASFGLLVACCATLPMVR